MAKTATELTKSLDAFTSALKRKIAVDRVFIWGEHVRGDANEHSDIRLMVISPDFEGKYEPERIDTLARVSVRIDPLIQAWGYTPVELADQRSGQGYIPLLGMMLHDSRESSAGQKSRSVHPKRGGHNDKRPD